MLLRVEGQGRGVLDLFHGEAGGDIGEFDAILSFPKMRTG